MNEEFKAFQKLLRSTEQLLTGEYSYLDSLEIRDSARELNKSLQPCLQELRLYATKFQPFIKACLDDLDHAEDVWNSKQRILDLSTGTIWEQVGRLTGFNTRFQELCQKQQKATIDQSNDLVTEMIETIKKKYFWDEQNSKLKNDLGWGDKYNFIKYVDNDIVFFMKKLEKIIELNLKQIVLKTDKEKEITLNIFEHFNLLDKNKSSIHKKQCLDKVERIKKYFGNIKCVKINDRAAVIKDRLLTQPATYIQKWNTQAGYIELSEVDRFGMNLKNEITNILNTLFSDRIEFIKVFVETSLLFYNDLLSKKSRYRQEKPEQRLAEKEWIDRQRQSLQEIQARLDEILN